MASANTKSIILTCYYRPKPGGLCKRLFRAMESLLAAGHDVHYLAVEPFPIKHKNCNFHRFPWPLSMTDNLAFWAVFHFLSPLILLYIGIRYRITHTFAFGSTYSLFLQPLRLLRKVPLTLFLRADTLENHRLKKTQSWIIGLERIIEGLSITGIRVYGVTNTLTNKIVDRHRKLKPLIYGTLMNDIVLLTEKMPMPKIPAGEIRFGCVGVLEDRKNISLILQCMNHFRHEDIHLSIFGGGPAEQQLRYLTQTLGISDKVSFMGWVSTPSHIWEKIDFLLFPSLHEGASNAVLEAIAYGVPVLANNIPEHQEILPLTSLVPENSIDSWIQFLAKILHNPSAAAQNIVQRQSQYTQKLRFDWNARISELILE